MRSSDRRRKQGMSQAVQLTLEHEHDFWTQVDTSDEDGCWPWKGPTDSKGYGFMWVAGQRHGAHRIAWILHHSQPLESYKQVRRKCRSGVCCVRPDHQTRADRSYENYVKSRGNPKFTVVRPPERGKTDAPRAETIRALAGSHEELRELKRILGVLTGALPQRDREDAKRHKKTHSSVESLVAIVDGLGDDIVEFRAQVDERLRRIERMLAPRPTEAAPEAPAQAPPAADPPKSEPPAARRNAVLVAAFQEAIGGPDEPSDEDHEALETVFEVALSDAQNAEGAVQIFGQWLTAFQELTAERADLDRSPQSFAREVSHRRLGP